MKLSESGQRTCDNVNCQELATHTLFWTEQAYFCEQHAAQAIGIGNSMGFSTPAKTVRLMNPDEMKPSKG